MLLPTNYVPDCILHIGAGHCSELPQYLASKARQVVLLEASSELVRRLQANNKTNTSVQVVQAVVAAKAARADFYEYNLSTLNSIHPASDALKQRYPGLSQLRRRSVQAEAIGPILQRYLPKLEQSVLVLDTPGEEAAILQVLAESGNLTRIGQLVVYADTEAAYQNSQSADALVQQLQKAGLELASSIPGRDPSRVAFVFRRNPLADQVEALTEKVKKLEGQLKVVQDENKSLTGELSDHKTWLANRKKHVAELEEKLESAQQQADSLKALGKLESRIEQLFDQQSAQLQGAANALGQHVSKSMREQRQHFQAINALAHYMETGQTPLELGGWAINADLAAHLVRAIEQNAYDLVIEFGSGSSTLLIARALGNRLRLSETVDRSSALEYENDAAGHESTRATDRALQSGRDLPQRILSFEQQESYHRKTSSALAHEGLTGLVDLVLSPLVPTQLSQRSDAAAVFFYDCEAALVRIARMYQGRQAKILVLVDGPFSPQNDPLAREPALDHLLQHLSAHHLHVVLDDANRQGEQEVSRYWRTLCEQRGLNVAESALDTDKGALWMTITP